MCKLTKTILYIALINIFFSTCAFAQQSASAMDTLDAEILKNKGKVIYLDFWASWCIPCRKSFPWMNKIQNQYSKRDFTIISVNLDVDKNLALEFLDELPATFPVIYDPKGQTARALKVKGMPSSYLLDRQGKIVKGHVGFYRDKITRYEHEIEQLVSK